MITRALRLMCFAGAGASGAALLAKVYGIASMQSVVLFIALPFTIVLIVIAITRRNSRNADIPDAIAIGSLGGLAGTFAYDLARVPFALVGRRIFAPIAAYGVWIADVDASSRITEVIGWSYHFWNGIGFGVMYALFMQRRPWYYAVLWGLTLETIAVVSPFARMFSIAGDYSALGIAYMGHVAYGIPLGLVVQEWDSTKSWLTRLPQVVWWIAAVGMVVLTSWRIASPQLRARDSRRLPGSFKIEGSRLNPDWLRLDGRGTVRLVNTSESLKVVRIRGNAVVVPAHAIVTRVVDTTGIVRAFIETTNRPQSSFIIAEPAEVLR